MATTETSYRVLSLPQEGREGDGDRVHIRLRRTFDIGAFGAGAVFQRRAGEIVVPNHHEAGPGGDRHEELYVVVQGSASFTVDGETIDAPQGTAIFVQDPAVMRTAVATSDQTIVLAVGGPRDHAYRITPAASQEGFWDAYQAKNYGAALEAVERGLEMYPGNAHLLYNVACMQSLLGDTDAALAALADSVDQWELYKEQAQKDDDFTSIREDPRFVALIG